MRWVLIFAVASTALALAGCGGSNNASSNTTTTESTTTSETTTTTSSASTTTTEAGGATTPTFASGKCKDLAASAQKIGQDFSAAGAGNGNITDAANEFQAFVKVVPSEIRADVQTIADAITKYAAALKGIDLSSGQTPSAADLQKIQGALSSLNEKKLQAAELRINAWTKKNC